MLSSVSSHLTPEPIWTPKSVGLSSPIAIHYSPTHGASGTLKSESLTSDTTGLSTPYGGLTPQQLRGAYGVSSLNFNGITGDGSGETIAILDAGDDTGLVNSTSSLFSTSDLAIFDRYYGLPDPPSFIKDGFTDASPPELTTTLPAAGSGDVEISLDVEWAHVMAPKANILLVEGAPDFSDIYNGVLAVDNAPASMHICALSMSFDGAESAMFSSTADAEAMDGSYFDNAGLVYVAAAGDYGAYAKKTTKITPQFPASSSNVLAVGGTTLSVSGNNYSSEATWGNGTSSGTNSAGGGGISLFEPLPAYQTGKINGLSSSHRAYPDISIEGNDAPGVAIYDSPDYGTGTGWFPGTVGGTSLSAPMMAGIIADADQGRALKGLAPLNSSGGSGVSASNPNHNSSALDIHTLLYGLGYSNSDFHDITTGTSNGPSSYGPQTGYDLSTGLGTPIANSLVVDLSGTSATPAVDLPAITNLYVKQSSATQVSLWVNSATPGSGTATATYLLADASGINYSGGAGNDTLTLDYSNGNFASGFSNEVPAALNTNPSPSAAPINFIGAGTSNTIAFVGTSSNDTLTATATTFTPSGGLGSTPIAVSNLQDIQFNGGSGGADTLNVNSSPTGGYVLNNSDPNTNESLNLDVDGAATSVVFNATQQLNALMLTDGALATLSLSGADGSGGSLGTVLSLANTKVLVLNSLSIPLAGAALANSAINLAQGTLDLTNNSMIVNYIVGSNAAALAAVDALAKTGSNDGNWNGTGLTSSTARTDAANNGYTALAVADNGDLGYDSFAGRSNLSHSQILVMYTYYGDENLDGEVNNLDLQGFEAGIGPSPAGVGWEYGQLDYGVTPQASNADFLAFENGLTGYKAQGAIN